MESNNFNLLELYNKFFLTRADHHLLNQQYKLLETKFEKIKFEKSLTANKNIIVSKLEDLFSKKQTWTNLSQIELFLVSLYSESEVSLEIKIKLLEAKEKLNAQTVKFFEDEIKLKLNVQDKKSLLNSLNEKLQLADDIQNLEKTYITLTRIRTSFLFFVALAIFFAIDQLTLIKEFLSLTKGTKGDAILTALSSGWLGTSFSMLLGLRSRITESSLMDLKVIHRLDYIFSRAIIGFTSGLIMYYIFQSKLISGPFFPEFQTQVPIFDDKAYALLVVWCFISGFSEKLVPDILTQTEKNISKEEE